MDPGIPSPAYPLVQFALPKSGLHWLGRSIDDGVLVAAGHIVLYLLMLENGNLLVAPRFCTSTGPRGIVGQPGRGPGPETAKGLPRVHILGKSSEHPATSPNSSMVGRSSVHVPPKPRPESPSQRPATPLMQKPESASRSIRHSQPPFKTGFFRGGSEDYHAMAAKGYNEPMIIITLLKC